MVISPQSDSLRPVCLILWLPEFTSDRSGGRAKKTKTPPMSLIKGKYCSLADESAEILMPRALYGSH